MAGYILLTGVNSGNASKLLFIVDIYVYFFVRLLLLPSSFNRQFHRYNVINFFPTFNLLSKSFPKKHTGLIYNAQNFHLSKRKS